MPEAISDSLLALSPEMQKAFQASVQAERRQLQPLVARKERAETKVKALDEVLSRVERVAQTLPTIGSPVAFRELNLESGNPAVLSGFVDKTRAMPGDHSLEVLDLAHGASAISNGFAERSDTVGTGYVLFTGVDGQTREIFIDRENGTLDGIARLVNSAALGYRASVVKEESDPDRPWRLVLTAEGARAGADVSFPQTFFIDGDLDLVMEDKKAATNARVKYQGLELEHEGNEIRDLIEGVTLQLKGTTEPGRPTNVAVRQDVPKTAAKVKEMVDSLNGVFTYIQDQYKHEPGEVPGTKPLSSDSGVRLAESRLKSALQAAHLSRIGIQLTRDGKLTLDEAKLDKALANDYEGVNRIVTGELAPRLNNAVKTISARDGLVGYRKQTTAQQVRDAQGEIEKREKNSIKRLDALKEKLARAQQAAAKMQGQAARLASMPSAQNDPVVKLLEGM